MNNIHTEIYTEIEEFDDINKNGEYKFKITYLKMIYSIYSKMY